MLVAHQLAAARAASAAALPNDRRRSSRALALGLGRLPGAGARAIGARADPADGAAVPPSLEVEDLADLMQRLRADGRPSRARSSAGPLPDGRVPRIGGQLDPAPPARRRSSILSREPGDASTATADGTLSAVRTWVLVVAAVAGCTGAPAPDPAPLGPAPTASGKPAPAPSRDCVVSVDNPGGRLAINGVVLTDLTAGSLRPVLGEPDRIERVTREERYEEYGEMPSSTMEEVTDVHLVHERQGLVFRTRNGAFSSSEIPIQLVVFLSNERRFDNRESPAVVPAGRGGCRLEINGVAVDPRADLRPLGATYRSTSVEIFGTRFGLTSYATAIDGLYTSDGARSIHIHLDAPETGRASYVEIQ
jgi:hypothetical protein